MGLLWNLLVAFSLLWQCSKPKIFILHAAWQCQGKRCRQVVSHFLPQTPYCFSCSFCIGPGQSCHPGAVAVAAAAVAVAQDATVWAPVWHPFGRIWFHTFPPHLGVTVFLSFWNLLSPKQFVLEIHLECPNNVRSRFIKIPNSLV